MTHATAWWTTFFQGDAVLFWRQFQSPAQNRAEADFAVQVLRLGKAARVLDVPCGDGRITLELAARGFAPTGVDLAHEAIEFARAQAQQQGLRVRFERRDMRDLPEHGTFDAALCLGNSFAYMDDQGNRDFLAAVHAALCPGGRFLLHTGLVHELLLLGFERRAWYRGGDVILLAEREYDPVESAMNLTYGFLCNGKLDYRPARYRIYSVRELRELITSVGMRPTDMFGSTGGEPFKLGSQTLYLAAEKPR
ncbi:MAG: class I SAM-dependent methyltransferase [Planctomycetota bacterium]